MIVHPVPHDKEAWDHHVGEQSGDEEHPGDHHLVLHDDHARAGTLSAQVSILASRERHVREIRGGVVNDGEKAIRTQDGGNVILAMKENS